MKVPATSAPAALIVVVPLSGLASTFRWIKDETGNLSAIQEDGRVCLLQGALVIRRVVREDAGKYQCIVRNSIGETRTESALVVTTPLQVAVLPPHQVSNTGEEATFTCKITGYPVHTIAWTKDQRPIVASDRVRLPSPDVLHVVSLRREDRGMYQCFAYNDNDGAQGTAELKIADVPPSMISVFSERTLQPGDGVSLKCVVMGSPFPRVTWYLDSSVMGQTGRISMGDYITDDAHVVSFFNISEVLQEDGGEYGCEASNVVGSASHFARLNVFGPAFVRLMPNVTAISGQNLVVKCPYGGYPIKSIRWFAKFCVEDWHRETKPKQKIFCSFYHADD
ncbi:down syndrome cell adhesion molecule-like protein Dscam2 [Caerostris extrusa]|uniref:Down syndrome cell adhesion molecule-like protein Dscam2 n=1 Tax=Caerostris extrusa TaxID=172846 RepID=A0AAV4SVX1_CAEEX|nr:down syndrome cell adhesion molecule-like protein Dscam2 [Caerostris extrusa]